MTYQDNFDLLVDESTSLMARLCRDVVPPKSDVTIVGCVLSNWIGSIALVRAQDGPRAQIREDVDDMLDVVQQYVAGIASDWVAAGMMAISKEWLDWLNDVQLVEGTGLTLGELRELGVIDDDDDCEAAQDSPTEQFVDQEPDEESPEDLQQTFERILEASIVPMTCPCPCKCLIPTDEPCTCGGSRRIEIMAPRYSPPVAGLCLLQWIIMICADRANGEDIEQMLDVAQQYVQEVLRGAMTELSRQVGQPASIDGSSALTQDELQELGVLS